MVGGTARTFSARLCFSRGSLRLAFALLLCLTLLLRHGDAAQNGFISIDCGSDSNYTDSTTGLAWSTDDGFISTGTNQKTQLLVSDGEMQQLATARVFSQDSSSSSMSKNCYVLPVTDGSTYLIRASFLLGELQAISTLASSISFNLSIDSTVVEAISFSATDVDMGFFTEYMVTSSKAEIDFCIIPVDGDAFISSLELRPLLETMYLGATPSQYTKMVQRMNCGAASTAAVVRYPDDPYDRMWLPPNSTYDSIDSINTTTSSLNVTTKDKPPLAVMQSAWKDSEISFQWSINADASSYYVGLYFDDFTLLYNASQNRIVDVLVNGKILSSGVTITNYSQETIENNFEISGSDANFTLTKGVGAQLNPLVNAIELHAIYPAVTTSTASEDVSALNAVRQSFGLSKWTGDPCLPVSWDWVTCSPTAGNSPPRVTKINLSSAQISGRIPANISGLTELTDLWLDHNSISGAIPDLSGLNSLRTLHLQSNSLTGPVPASLASIPNLSELFLEGNRLSGPVPAALLSKNGLNLQVDPSVNVSTNVSAPAPAPVLAPAPTPTTSPPSSSPPAVSSVPPDPTSSSGRGSTRAKVGAVIGASVAWILIAAIVTYCCCCCRRRRNRKKLDPESPSFKDRSGTLGIYPGSLARSSFSQRLQMQRSYALAQVRDATNNFRWKIGEGGFGPVYYGTLPTTEEIAVKVNSTADAEEMENEFATEVGLLSVVHHRNLLTLLGFCEEDNHKILIYEYMPKGTLRDHLYGKAASETLEWRTRLKIALDAARGLEYLHHDCNPKIIHRDMKSNNILLNEKMQAKVADFGISKLAPEEGKTTGVITVVRGTTGYFDPEYFTTNKITQKSDVYSFGVVLLEILSGRPPNDNRMANSQINLVQYARRALREGCLERLVDPGMQGDYNIEAVWKVAELALSCVEPLGVNRPDMRDVVRGLLEARSLELQRESESSNSFAFVSSQGETTQSSLSSDSSAPPNSDSSPTPAASHAARMPTVRSLQSSNPPSPLGHTRRHSSVSFSEASPSPSTAFLDWNAPGSNLHPR